MITNRAPENSEFFMRSGRWIQISSVTADSATIDETKLFAFRMKKLPKKSASPIIATGIASRFRFFFPLFSFCSKTASYITAATPPHTNPKRASSIPIAVPVIVSGDHQSIVYIIETSGPMIAKRIETDSISFLRSFLHRNNTSQIARRSAPISRYV